MNKTLPFVRSALCAAVIAVCAWLTVPSVVPFTMQTFAVFLTLWVLGGGYGTLAIAVYLLLGAVGVPVFAGFKGGIGALLGTTGGYLIGFLVTGGIYALAQKLFGTRLWVRIAALVIGLLACYAFGTAWFCIVYARTNGAIGVGTALSWCVLPFLLPDAAKLALAVFVGSRLEKITK